MGAPIYQNAASYGYSGQDENLGIKKKDKKPDSNNLEEQTKKTEKEKIAKAAEKKRLNTKTTETKAKTVKQGKLSRKQGVELAKKAAKDKKKAILDKPNMDAEGAVGSRKVARANKRQEMRDIRNKERGARRTDRANRSIKRIGDRNDMTVGEATKAYNDRQEVLGGYKKGERGPNPANVDKQTDLDAKNEAAAKKSEAERLKQVQDRGEYGYTPTGGAASTNVDVPEVKSGIDMLDMPTQQEASEDSQGISSYMNNSENRRGR